MESKLKLIESDQPWYKEGLHFQCTECGQCCTGQPGYVWVTEEEIAKIAAYLKMPLDKFKRMYLRMKNNRYALVERKSHHYDCIFLQGKHCQIYPVRPKQCRTFPFWEENLRSPESWLDVAKTCEGIRPDSPKVPFEEISRILGL